jgi:hypothetical protein
VKRAALALRSASVAVARAIDLEGAFLIIGTALIAAAASYVHPAGPLLVVGVTCTLAGLALARRSG